MPKQLNHSTLIMSTRKLRKGRSIIDQYAQGLAQEQTGENSQDKPLDQSNDVVEQGVQIKHSNETIGQSNRMKQSGKTEEQDRQISQLNTTIDQNDKTTQSTESEKQTAHLSKTTGQLTGRIVDKAAGLLIPESINQKLNDAVSYYKKKHPKIDRSAVVSALLGDPQLWEQSHLDAIMDTVVDQLNNKLRDRLERTMEKSAQ